jgi:hypothetical protein
MRFSQYNDPGSSRRKFKIPITIKHSWLPIAFILVCIYRNQNIFSLSMPEALAGLMIAFLSVLPLFIWASQSQREPPAFQCFCAIHFPYFAYPILVTKADYMAFPEVSRLTADATVIVYLAIAILVYYMPGGRKGETRLSRLIPYRVIPEATAAKLSVGLMIVWTIFVVGNSFGYFDIIMTSIRGSRNIIHALGLGSAAMGGWISMQRWGEGRLSGGEKAFVVICITVALVVQFATTMLISGMTFLVICIVAYTQGRSRVPWLLIAASIGLLAFLNLGKAEVRQLFLRGGPTLTVSRIIEIYERWIPASIHVLTHPELRIRDNRDVLARANLIQVHAKIVHLAPESRPFLYGQTYAYVPLVLVPRILWSKKPHVHIATEIIGRTYGVLSSSTLKGGTTTVGIGPISEAWANFGWLGVVLCGAGIGAIMRVVGRACAGAHPRSLHMLASVVWVALSFQIELPASGWFASLETQLLVLMACLYPISRAATRPGEAPQVRAMAVPA